MEIEHNTPTLGKRKIRDDFDYLALIGKAHNGDGNIPQLTAPFKNILMDTIKYYLVGNLKVLTKKQTIQNLTDPKNCLQYIGWRFIGQVEKDTSLTTRWPAIKDNAFKGIQDGILMAKNDDLNALLQSLSLDNMKKYFCEKINAEIDSCRVTIAGEPIDPKWIAELEHIRDYLASNLTHYLQLAARDGFQDDKVVKKVNIRHFRIHVEFEPIPTKNYYSVLQTEEDAPSKRIRRDLEREDEDTEPQRRVKGKERLEAFIQQEDERKRDLHQEEFQPKIHVKQKSKRRKGPKQPKQQEEVGLVDSISSVPMFHNLTNIKVPEHIKNLLEKGYKYIPTLKPHFKNIFPAWEELTNTLRQDILVQAEKEKDNFIKLEILPQAENIMRMYNYNVAMEIKQMASKFKPKEDLSALRKWLFTHNLMIINADKNLGLVIVDTPWYQDQLAKHLHTDAATYELMPNAPNIEDIKRQLETILEKEEYQSIPKTELPKLDFKANYAIPNFYLIAKVHKKTPETRPIVPSYNWVTTAISQWLDRLFQPLIKQHLPWIMHNSRQAILEIQNYHAKQTDVLAAIDAKSLYTNINIPEGIRRVKVFLSKYCGYTPVKAKLIGDLMQWVCDNNCFQVGNNYYHQKIGIAMGSAFAPAFANIFVAMCELQWKQKYPLEYPKLYLRYIDDIFCIWDIPHDKANEFIETKMNTFSKSLSFTYETSSEEATFLDLKIFKGKTWSKTRVLDINLYEKPTNMHIFTDPGSNYPFHYKYSWINGENVRYIRNSSSLGPYIQEKQHLEQYLLNRGYSLRIVSSMMSKFNYADRASLLHRHKVKPKREGKTIVIKHLPGWQILKKNIELVMEHLKTIPYVPLDYKYTVVGKGLSTLNIAKKMHRERPIENDHDRSVHYTGNASELHSTSLSHPPPPEGDLNNLLRSHSERVP